MTNFDFIYTEWMADFNTVYKGRLNGILTCSLATKYSNYLSKFSSHKRGDNYTSFRSHLIEVSLGKRAMNVALFNSTMLSLAYGNKIR
jgi:hypothetical protein